MGSTLLAVPTVRVGEATTSVPWPSIGRSRPERVADDGDGIAALETARVALQAEHARGAAVDDHAQDADVRAVGRADEASLEPLAAAGELDRDAARRLVAVHADQHVLVGDERAL